MPRKFESCRLSRRAEIDLAEIYAYTTAHWSAEQANRYLSDIRAAFDGLVARTKIGHPRQDVAAGYLSYAVGAHLIFYRATEHILVVRVLHGSMDYTRRLQP